MNPTVQKYAPPMVVLGAVLYWGWPPVEPLDLGNDLVKARAVHWKAADLESPREPENVVDPFRPVLVAKQETEQAEEQIAKMPVGPSEDNIRAVLRLTGIAKMGGRSFAIINGKACVAGERLRTYDDLVKSCKLMSIHPDHVVVQCEQTFAVIRPQVSRRSTRKTLPSNSADTPAKETTQGAPPPDAGTPSQASLQRSGNGATQIKTNRV
jgi:hypothetical protein